MAVSKRLRFEIFRRDNHTCRYCGASAPDVTLEPDHVVPTTLGGTDEPSNLVTACQDCNSGKTSISPDADLVEDVEQDALRWSAAMEKAAEAHRKQAMHVEIMTDLYGDDWQDAWCGGSYLACYEPEANWHYTEDPDRTYPIVIKFFPHGSGDEQKTRWLFDDLDEADEKVKALAELKSPPRPKDWRSAVRAWIGAGITQDDFRRLVHMVVEERGYVQWDRKWQYLAGCVWNVIRERQAVARAMLTADDGEDG